LELFAFCVRKSGARKRFVCFSASEFFQAGWQAKRTKKKKIAPAHRTAEGVLAQTEEKKSTKHRNEYLQVLSSAHALDILRSYYYSY